MVDLKLLEYLERIYNPRSVNPVFWDILEISDEI